MKKIFLLAIAAFAIISCDKMNSDLNGERELTIKAVAPKTKTQLTDELQVHWTPGDVIKVCFEPPYSTASSNSQIKHEVLAELTAQNTEVSGSATFTGYWNASAPMYSAGVIVYPASLQFSSSQSTSSRYVTTNVSYNLPTIQEAIEGNFANNLNLSYATVTYNQLYKNNPSVTFKNVCSLIRINLPETDYDVKSITIESGNELGIMAGNAKLEWSTSSTNTGLKFDSNKHGISESTPVTLQKNDGSSLIPGASYYAVVWPNTHNKLTFTFKNAEGSVCVKEFDPGLIYCNPSECITLNVKSLSFSSEPRLEIDTNPIEINHKGSEGESLFVNANCNWTATSSNTNMVTITESGNSSLTFKVTENTAPEDRSATITISYGHGSTKTIIINQPSKKYKIVGSCINKAASLEDGATYMFFFAGGNNANEEQPYCWKADGSGVINRHAFQNKSSLATRDLVFKFHKSTTLKNEWTSDGQNYKSAISGYLQAMYRERYMVQSSSNLDFTGDNPSLDLRFGNAWANESGSDIDIWVSTNQTIYWNGYYLYWGGTSNTPRKWFLYKVIEAN